MKTLVKVVVAVLVVLVLAVTGGYVWATVASNRVRAAPYETHAVDFPIPFPLDPEEAVGLSPEEADRIALERAVERGRHLVSSRYVCVGCHGANLAGGTMVDRATMTT